MRAMAEAPQQREVPFRSFGILKHKFPEMTWTEKAFLVAFVLCGGIVMLAARGARMSDTDLAVAAPFMGTMSCVMGYWMRHEPEACLQFIVFPFLALRVRWPRSLVRLVRWTGVFIFFNGIFAPLCVVLPHSWLQNLLVVPILLTIALAATAALVRKPRNGLAGGAERGPNGHAN